MTKMIETPKVLPKTRNALNHLFGMVKQTVRTFHRMNGRWTPIFQPFPQKFGITVHVHFPSFQTPFSNLLLKIPQRDLGTGDVVRKSPHKSNFLVKTKFPT